MLANDVHFVIVHNTDEILKAPRTVSCSAPWSAPSDGLKPRSDSCSALRVMVLYYAVRPTQYRLLLGREMCVHRESGHRPERPGIDSELREYAGELKLRIHSLKTCLALQVALFASCAY